MPSDKSAPMVGTSLRCMGVGTITEFLCRSCVSRRRSQRFCDLDHFQYFSKDPFNHKPSDMVDRTVRGIRCLRGSVYCGFVHCNAGSFIRWSRFEISFRVYISEFQNRSSCNRSSAVLPLVVDSIRAVPFGYHSCGRRCARRGCRRCIGLFLLCPHVHPLNKRLLTRSTNRDGNQLPYTNSAHYFRCRDQGRMGRLRRGHNH